MALSEQAREFLDDLMASHSPAGNEAPAQAVVRDYLAERLGDRVAIRTDRNDNVIATIRGDSRPHVALLAHVDTIGLIVTNIDGAGMVRVGMIGRPDAEALVAQVVTIHAREGDLEGVVFRAKRGDGKVTVDDLAIDTGLAGDEVRRRVRIGDTVSWAARPRAMGDGRLVGPAFDDRAGVVAACEILVAAASADPGPAVSVVSCIQEEGPTRMGARMTVPQVRPDLIVVLDTIGADDARGGDRIRMGGGPVIARGGSTHNRTSDALLDLAERTGIDHQIEPVGRDSGTDLEAALAAAAGQAVGVLVSIPHRHYHSANEMLDPADLAATIDLVTRFLADLPDVL